MNRKYETLVRTLDQIRKEAKPEYKAYYPLESDIEGLNHARSRAFIHLYLKTKFGMLNFESREKCVTDGKDDGGIDGFYIDEINKKMYFIQSKFRTEEANFYNKEISLQEILKMEVKRILEGQESLESGDRYNGKIQGLIRTIKNIPDQARYEPIVVILANIQNVTEDQLKKLTGGFKPEVCDYAKVFEELLFPVVSGAYFCEKELYIYLNLSNKTSGPKIKYLVETEAANCEVTVVFVPTIEIARVFGKYKNSILRFNPRSYLGLFNNPVNTEIAKTMREIKTNEFALFNNGITILSDDTDITEYTGIPNRAQMRITNPQIINGGQTGFALHQLYEEGVKKGDPEGYFQNKEVLVKVITFVKGEGTEEGPKKLRLIESISKASNQQTNVTEADRRSNDEVQIELQKKIYDEFGYFYERKRGEFWDGLRNNYIGNRQVINREVFLRICVACNGLASQARRNSENALFSQDKFYGKLRELEKTRKYFFGYVCHEVLGEIEKKFEKNEHNRFGVINYGNGVRYGKMAVVSAVSRNFDDVWPNVQFREKAEQLVNKVLSDWLAFENFVKKQPHTEAYFRTYYDETSESLASELDFDNYYKGRTVNKDLEEYFIKPLHSPELNKTVSHRKSTG